MSAPHDDMYEPDWIDAPCERCGALTSTFDDEPAVCFDCDRSIPDDARYAVHVPATR